ncbi:MAG: nitrilase-related carbon-nitrogen hydrolase [Ruminococcus sp.]
MLLQARAIENQVYLLGVNCVGTQGDLQFVGGSQLVDPEGTVRLDCGSAEQLAYVTVDSDVAEFRQAFPTYRDSQTARMPIYIKPCEIITDRKSGGKPIPFGFSIAFLVPCDIKRNYSCAASFS